MKQHFFWFQLGASGGVFLPVVHCHCVKCNCWEKLILAALNSCAHTMVKPAFRVVWLAINAAGHREDKSVRL